MFKLIMNKNNELSQFLRPIIFIIITLNSWSTNAAQNQHVALWLGLDTYHVDRTNDNATNENNKITSIFYNRWFISTFINSYNKRSYLLGYQIWYNQMPFFDSNIEISYGVSIAAATGYGRNLATNIDGIVTLGVSPFVGAEYDVNQDWTIGGDLLYIPTDNGGVLTSGLKLRYRF
ncbi:hypothetical protein [Psychrosphaera algicola]|uniref:DUF3575 domain-containing protein n=1 Tax=Psychrosphaera algicola TaxID=3023714 RepID=A0ABT5FI82_9GAMM|nr:hypothetical protein [Psychrosphaera sp. G1-22]MDC2890915.1 hypothetical protein [Psychrosphaera sp. G1-22]